MRNPDRIHPIIEELEKLWNQFPDFRFFQLIQMLQGGKDRFYVEDDITYQILKGSNEQIAAEQSTNPSPIE